MGLLLTDLRAEFPLTRLMPLDSAMLVEIGDAVAQVTAEAEDWFRSEEIEADKRGLTRRVDMRYEGQNYELSVELPEGPVTEETLKALRAGFTEAHKRLYGFAVEDERIFCVTFRAEAVGQVEKATLASSTPGPEDARHAIIGARQTWYPETGCFTETTLYARERLRPGMRFDGPAIVEQMDTTTLIPPGVSAHVDATENLILELGQ